MCCIQKAFWFLLVILSMSTGCSNMPYKGRDVLGADDFVIDSYKIREGKFSVLETMEGKEYPSLSSDLLDPYPDVIQEGDVLQIALFHPTRADLVASFHSLSQAVGFCVQEGKVILPDLEPIYVTGLTLDLARIKIQENYQEHIKDIQVFLSFTDRKERKVELAGLVQLATVPVDGRMRLFETLALAKVPANANLFRSYLVREQQMLPVDFYKLLKRGDMSQNVVMRGGDKIYIADAADTSLMVLGEVGKECMIDMPDGFMTLRAALAAAGGIPYTGDKSYIQVIRGNIMHPKIYTLNWQHVIHLPNDSMLLMPGDIVYVAAKPLTEWNRFVTQVLPTLIGFDLVSKGIKSISVTP